MVRDSFSPPPLKLSQTFPEISISKQRSDLPPPREERENRNGRASPPLARPFSFVDYGYLNHLENRSVF